MSTVNSLSSAYSSNAQPLTPYERNAKMYGPAAASAIGLADAATEAASSTVSFSSKALNELSEAGKTVVNTVSNTVSNTYHALGNVVDGVEQGVKELGLGIAHLASEGADEMKSATHTAMESARDATNFVGDTVNTVASAVGDAAGTVLDAVSSAASNITDYATLGVAAADNLISTAA